MKQFQIFWRENAPLQFRNTVSAEPLLPETVYADEWKFVSVCNSLVGINFLRGDEVFLTFFEIPAYIRDLDATIPQQV